MMDAQLRGVLLALLAAALFGASTPFANRRADRGGVAG